MLASNANITPNSSGTPSRLLDLYKKPLLDVTNSATPPSATQLITGLKADPIKIPIASRLQALANSQPAKEAQSHTKANSREREKEKEKEKEIVVQKVESSQTNNAIQNNPSPVAAQPTSFSGIQINSFVPVTKPSSVQSSPNSVASPLPIMEASPSPTSKPSGGFQMTFGSSNPSNSNSIVKKDDEDSRQSFSSAPSPGMVSPQGTCPKNVVISAEQNISRHMFNV